MENDVPQMKQENGNDGVKPIGELVLDFFDVLVRRRRFVFRFVLLTTLLAAGVAAVLPKWYKSSASVFPAEQPSIFSGIESFSAIARSFGTGRIGGLGQRPELERYMAILNSESVLMKVIERFDLTSVYGITSYPREKTMKELLSNTEFEYTDEGGLMISVYDKEPQRAAAMANYFVQVLNETNSRMLAQNARASREFIGEMVELEKADLRMAEDSLKKFQEEKGMIIIPEPGTGGMAAVGELYLLKARKEVEVGILERLVSQESPLLHQARVELHEINKKVDQLPDVSIGSLRLYRDVYVQQKIMEFLVPLYEQAKVEEQRATPSVMVLDYAEVPERKAKPKISLYGLLGFVVSLIIALIVVFTLEGIERLRRMEPERFSNLIRTARSDWLGLRLKRKPPSES